MTKETPIAQFYSTIAALTVQGKDPLQWQFNAGVLLFHQGDETNLADFRATLETMAPGGRSKIREISLDKARAVAKAHAANQPQQAQQGATTSTAHPQLQANARLAEATGPEGRAFDQTPETPETIPMAAAFVQTQDVSPDETVGTEEFETNEKLLAAAVQPLSPMVPPTAPTAPTVPQFQTPVMRGPAKPETP